MKKYCTVYFLLLLLFCLPGCSKRTPDPPTVRTGLVLETFAALDRKDYDFALQKIKTLRKIDPSNAFLSEFESVEFANKNIKDAGDLLAKGKRAEAEKHIHNAVLAEGNSGILAAAERDILIVNEMEELMQVMVNPPDSEKLSKAVERFCELADLLKAPKSLTDKAELRLAKIPSMRLHEQKIENISLRLFEKESEEPEDPDFISTIRAVKQMQMEQIPKNAVKMF